MITVSKRPQAPVFGVLDGGLSKNGTFIRLSPTGEIIKKHIGMMKNMQEGLKMLQYVIMPDHVHLLIFVRHEISEHIGFTIARWKYNIDKEAGCSLFENGYNDQILKKSRSLDALYQYIRRNPYRLAVRRERPEFFARALNLRIGDVFVRAYGNMFLLRNPFKEQVVVHRRDSEHTKTMQRERWLYAAANGGVLVSPFISKAEKEIRTEAEALGARFILITNETMGERFKPSGRDFELCEQGRLLIISNPHPELDRAACLAMNRLAEELCDVADV